MHTEAEYDELLRDRDRVCAEARHWKSNHDNQVRKNRLLTDRLDMPVERIKAYEQVDRLEKLAAYLYYLVESYQDHYERGGAKLLLWPPKEFLGEAWHTRYLEMARREPSGYPPWAFWEEPDIVDESEPIIKNITGVVSFSNVLCNK